MLASLLMALAFVIGLGSNLGERERFIARGIEEVARMAQRVEALSRVYETAAIGPPQPAYLNAALRIVAQATPEALLEALLTIEAALGRVRDVRWGPRVLDLDILWSTQPYASESLTIPHAELACRNFALAPLLDVAPELAPEYADRLHVLGGRPPVWGLLRWDPALQVCSCQPSPES